MTPNPNLPPNGGNGPEYRHGSAFSCSLQGEKEPGDRGPAPGQSAGDAASKKNGNHANRARTWSQKASRSALVHAVDLQGYTAAELPAGPSFNRKRSGRGPGLMWLH